MQVAIASSQGTRVDQHFGKTDNFLIYSLDKTGLTLEEQRKVDPLSTGDKNHSFDLEKFTQVYGALSDCKRVYCAKIGARPKNELARRGIETVEFTGLIKEIFL